MDLIDQTDRRCFKIAQIYKYVLINMYGRHISAQNVAEFIGLMCRAHINVIDYLKNLPKNNDTYFTQLMAPYIIQNVIPDFETAVKYLLNYNANLAPVLRADAFVTAISEISPYLNWADVCDNFDHPEFIIIDRIGLNLLLTIINLAPPFRMMIPRIFVSKIYNHWRNVDVQYSLVSTMLKNPDLFSFLDYMYIPVQAGLLKFTSVINKDIAVWNSLQFVDILLYFGDNGYVQEVAEIFEFPLQNCPDLLFMALLQIRSPITFNRKWLFSILIPSFLGNHPNCTAILHHAWNSTNLIYTLRPIIMDAMCDWYIRGDNDESRLSTILDFALEYNALFCFLDIPSFVFAIELACLASKRNYMNLENWLYNKICFHGEPFVVDLVKFLQCHYHQIARVKIPDDQTSKSSFQIPHEYVITMLTCLRNALCISFVSQKLYYKILDIMQKYSIIIHYDWTTSSGSSSN